MHILFITNIQYYLHQYTETSYGQIILYSIINNVRRIYHVIVYLETKM